MAFLTFKGGVHPYDGKSLTKDSPAEPCLPRGEMVYPLSQHIGAPAAPVVQKGDHVKRTGNAPWSNGNNGKFHYYRE